MEDYREEYEDYLRNISPIFKDVRQDEFTINFKNETIVSECFTINGYEFAKEFIADERYNHLFKDITFQYDYYNHIVFVGNDEVYSGIELLNTIKGELNLANQLEDLIHYFCGEDFSNMSTDEFLSAVFDFNDKYENAIEDLDTFINDNEKSIAFFRFG